MFRLYAAAIIRSYVLAV